VELSYFGDGLIGETATLPTVIASLSGTIRVVDLISSDEKVIWIYTRRIVATMQYA
jgi:hypothetical protein